MQMSRGSEAKEVIAAQKEKCYFYTANFIVLTAPGRNPLTYPILACIRHEGRIWPCQSRSVRRYEGFS